MKRALLSWMICNGGKRGESQVTLAMKELVDGEGGAGCCDDCSCWLWVVSGSNGCDRRCQFVKYNVRGIRRVSKRVNQSMSLDVRNCERKWANQVLVQECKHGSGWLCSGVASCFGGVAPRT
ncbi:hypothetical protein MRB53_005691 [Persea americana]|uniref:Uncharacterized protein n=1 Tax=Persea americana TaxID=3435 RepID=A0ACC2MEA6_PERAE|nr:hypothetical protein MRB53_005691 [Persea americana]